MKKTVTSSSGKTEYYIFRKHDGHYWKATNTLFGAIVRYYRWWWFVMDKGFYKTEDILDRMQKYKIVRVGRGSKWALVDVVEGE